MLRELLFELRIALKFLFVKPRGFYRIARFFTIATLAISVGALLVSLSAFEGYKKIISERYLDSSSHIIASKRFTSIGGDKQKVLEVLQNDVKAVAYSGYLELMLSSPKGLKGAAFQVAEPSSFDNVIPLSKYMEQGTADCIFQGENKAIIGSALAETFQLKKGDTISVVFLQSNMEGQKKSGTQKLYVCGISEFGLYDIDSRLCWISSNTAQRLFPGADFEASMKIRLMDKVDLDTATFKLQEALGHAYEVRSWKDINYGMIESIKLDRIVIFFILGILIAVAVFNVFATLIILIREMRVEISVLNILGLNAKRILRMFFMQSLILGLSGYVFGLVLWLLSLWSIKNWGIINLPKDIYLVSQVPIGVNLWDLFSVLFMVLLFVSLASVAPLMHLFRKFKKEGSSYGVKGQWAQ